MLASSRTAVAPFFSHKPSTRRDTHPERSSHSSGSISQPALKTATTVVAEMDPCKPHNLRSTDLSVQVPLRRWPTEFTPKRRFDRQSCNQSYVDYLRGHWEEQDDCLDEEPDADDNGSELSETEEDTEIDATDAFGQGDVISIFLRREARTLQYRDEAETIEGFCGDIKIEHLLKEGDQGSLVALLDDRSSSTGQRRFAGPLTAFELHQELAKEVRYLRLRLSSS